MNDPVSKKSIVPIETCKMLPDDQIREQIKIRHHWIAYVLVGSLYKDVLYSECHQLSALLDERRKKATGDG